MRRHLLVLLTTVIATLPAAGARAGAAPCTPTAAGAAVLTARLDAVRHRRDDAGVQAVTACLTEMTRPVSGDAPAAHACDFICVAVCPVFSSLSPGVPGAIEFTADGDVWVILIGWMWDCPPFWF